MMRQFGCLLALSLLTACAVPSSSQKPPEAEALTPETAPSDTSEPAAPSPSARTAEQFDTTTAEDRAEVVKAAATGAQDRALGTTVASLGDPADPGFWLKTPLVTAEQPGRVTYAAQNTSVAVTLIPIEGPETGGSRLSLPAMRLLQAPLTGLPEVAVFAR
ncbi:MAG: hypothetical protein AAGK28_14870 [Pseudomonadota bacterium]